MAAPRFRNPDLYQVNPIREHIREACPWGTAGFVAEDLDLIIRWYGAGYGLDGTGRFRLIENKYGTKHLDYAQRMTFGLIDRLCSTSPMAEERYDGFYVVQMNTDEVTPLTVWTVNGTDLITSEFDRWLQSPFSWIERTFTSGRTETP